MKNMEIWIVPFFGQGHMFPCMELSKLLATPDLKTALVISSNLSSSIPSSLRQHPFVQLLEVPSTPSPPPHPGTDPLHHHRHHHSQMSEGLEKLLSSRIDKPNSVRPVCAILDAMMCWSAPIFKNFDVPTIVFFTSGACASAMEYATWKAHPEDLKPDEIRLLPGLPEAMAITCSDLKRRPHGPPKRPAGGDPSAPPGPRKMGPPKPGDRPPWVDDVEGSIALLINTCDDLERPFITYIAEQIGRPVWGVGPLLPEQYWKSARSILHDHEIRTNRRSSIAEKEVIEWLDTKPHGSVLYVSFGSEVGPKMEEYPELADALECSTRPFIWVIQPGSGKPGPPQAEKEGGYFPEGLDKKVRKRGLIIRGWAPQLLILSHQSTGGFLSHCGWNSTVEAIGRGIPFLAWPIRGDQYYDAKLIVKHLKVGYMVSDDLSGMVKRDDIMKGIERLMVDEDMKKRADSISAKFQQGFPATSIAALDAFRDLIKSI